MIRTQRRLGLVLLAIVFWGSSSLSAMGRTCSASETKPLRILSWNIYMLPKFVQNTGKRIRAQVIAEELKASEYQVLVFQEAFLSAARRIIRKHLDGVLIKSGDNATYEALSLKSSQREMEAVKAERDSIKFKQVEFMAGKVGVEFDAIITGVADWGIYVQEQEALCEGMVKLASMKDDFYEHDASKYAVRGTRKGKVYRLGDAVRVKLVRADADERQLVFEMLVK